MVLYNIYKRQFSLEILLLVLVRAIMNGFELFRVSKESFNCCIKAERRA